MCWYSIRMAGKKILIVEDEKPLSKALSLKLSGSGFEVKVAGNGDEALEELNGTSYDLALLDIMMPKRDGFSVLEELKKASNKTPVFIMSNLGQNEDIKHAEALGAKGYIIKSNTPLSKIVEKITSFLQ